MFEWIPRTLLGFLAPVGGAHGVDLAGLALGQVLVLSKKSSLYVLELYSYTLQSHPNRAPKAEP